MWVVIKFKKENLSLLKEDLKKKLGTSPKIYIPTLQLFYTKKNKNFKKKLFILGDYLFCFHKSFEDKKIISSIKYCKGLKYIVEGFKDSQTEIKKFIYHCSKHEDNNGYLKQTFFEISTQKDFKFISGPFSDMIFQIINIQKNKIKILVGNLVTTISDKKNYLYQPA